jgi:hypothetical protein
MATGNKSRLSLKVFHFIVENHMAWNLLVANRSGFPIRKNPERDLHVLHLLGNCIRPEGVAILFVNFECLSGSLRYFNAKLVGPLEIASIPVFHKGNDPITLFQDMWNPPVESWLVVDSKDFCIFCCLDEMQFF